MTSEPVREGDDWPRVHDKLLEAEILVMASPTWLDRPSSPAWGHPSGGGCWSGWTRSCPRPTARAGRSPRVAGVVVTGNEDGAHHVISEISGALADIGYTIPGRAWTYWHLGPGPGPDYLDDEQGRDRSHQTGRAMAADLYGVASALAAHPLGAPPG